MIDLESLKPNDRNPRKIADSALEKLCESIKRDPQFMELRPIVVDEERRILGGNQRYRACLALGKKAIPESWVRVAAGLTKKQRDRFILIDNAPEGAAGYWDFDMLQEEWKIADLEALGFKFAESLDAMKEWSGMPEFREEDQSGYHAVIVHFATEGDMKAFAKMVKRPVEKTTRYLWFPEQPVKSVAGKSYKSREP